MLSDSFCKDAESLRLEPSTQNKAVHHDLAESAIAILPSAFRGRGGGGDGGGGDLRSDGEDGVASILNGQLCTSKTRLELTA